jgi:hypothetical protein
MDWNAFTLVAGFTVAGFGIAKIVAFCLNDAGPDQRCFIDEDLDLELPLQSHIARTPGLTAREYASLLNTDKYQVSRRLSALAEAGFVRNGKPRKCQITGRKSKTWFPNG